jgi:hypothetical protein
MAADHADETGAPGSQAASCQVWPVAQFRDRFKNPDPGWLSNEWTTVDDPRNRLIGDTATSRYVVEGSILRLSPDVPWQSVPLAPLPSYGATSRGGTRPTRPTRS